MKAGFFKDSNNILNKLSKNKDGDSSSVTVSATAAAAKVDQR